MENKKTEFDGGYVLSDENALRVIKAEKILAYTNFCIKSKQSYGYYMFVNLFGSINGVVDLNNIGIFCKTLKEDRIVGKILLDYIKTQIKKIGCHTIICQTSRQSPIQDRTKKILMENGFIIYQTHWSCDMLVFKNNYTFTQLETIEAQESGKGNWYFKHNYENAMSCGKYSPKDY